MEPIDRLEASMQALRAAVGRFRRERDEDRARLAEVRGELGRARDTIAGLQANLEALGGDASRTERGVLKKEIIERVRTVIARLDTLVQIESITNERQ